MRVVLMAAGASSATSRATRWMGGEWTPSRVSRIPEGRGAHVTMGANQRLRWQRQNPLRSRNNDFIGRGTTNEVPLLEVFLRPVWAVLIRWDHGGGSLAVCPRTSGLNEPRAGDLGSYLQPRHRLKTKPIPAPKGPALL